MPFQGVGKGKISDDYTDKLVEDYWNEHDWRGWETVQDGEVIQYLRCANCGAKMTKRGKVNS